MNIIKIGKWKVIILLSIKNLFDKFIEIFIINEKDTNNMNIIDLIILN